MKETNFFEKRLKNCSFRCYKKPLTTLLFQLFG